MLTTTARKVGNSTALSIPKQIGVETGTTYIIYKGANGSITLSPKIENPFLSDVPYEDDGNTFWQNKAVGEIENGI